MNFRYQDLYVHTKWGTPCCDIESLYSNSGYLLALKCTYTYNFWQTRKVKLWRWHEWNSRHFQFFFTLIFSHSVKKFIFVTLSHFSEQSLVMVTGSCWWLSNLQWKTFLQTENVNSWVYLPLASPFVQIKKHKTFFHVYYTCLYLKHASSYTAYVVDVSVKRLLLPLVVLVQQNFKAILNSRLADMDARMKHCIEVLSPCKRTKAYTCKPIHTSQP